MDTVISLPELEKLIAIDGTPAQDGHMPMVVFLRNPSHESEALLGFMRPGLHLEVCHIIKAKADDIKEILTRHDMTLIPPIPEQDSSIEELWG